MSVDFETVDEFLEHHGTKGMRWGVRKETSIDSGNNRPSSKSPSRSSGGKFVSNQKQHKGLTSGQKKALLVAGGVGALFVAGLILRNRNLRMKDAKAASDLTKGIGEARKTLNSLGDVKVSTVRKGFQVSSSGVASPIVTPIVSTLNPFKTPAGLFGR